MLKKENFIFLCKKNVIKLFKAKTFHLTFIIISNLQLVKNMILYIE